MSKSVAGEPDVRGDGEECTPDGACGRSQGGFHLGALHGALPVPPDRRCFGEHPDCTVTVPSLFNLLQLSAALHLDAVYGAFSGSPGRLLSWSGPR